MKWIPQEEVAFVLFDLRDPNDCEALHTARAVWQEASDIEAIDSDRFAVMIRLNSAYGTRREVA